MIYQILFYVGVVGIAVILVLRGHGGHHTVPGHHAGANGHHIPSARLGGANGHTNIIGGGWATFVGAAVSLLSPLAIDAICLGAGAAGLLLGKAHISPALRAVFASASGLGFFFFLVRPMWNFIFSFSSAPSAALDGAVGSTAEVLSAFNQSRIGLVKLQIDGQFVRMLADLSAEEIAPPSSFGPGDKLTVIAVDGKRNRCTVLKM